jgi:hypothetical protein
MWPHTSDGRCALALMEKIMSKNAYDTSGSAALENHRPLTELALNELDAVSGGVANDSPRLSGGYSLPVNYEAMTVWNTLLGQYGYSHGGIWPPY